MKRYVFGVAVLGVLVAGGLGYAAIPAGETAVISGCYEKRTGILRVIDAEAGKACTKYELPLSWNQAGPKGDPGAPGEAGPAGPAGPQGGQGEKGADGAQGDVGPAGPQGEAGPAGAAGAQGEKGDAGPQGPAGPKGDDGATGVAGPAGPKGETGAGVRWLGDYQSGPGSPLYEVGDLVRRNGAIWVAKQQVNSRCHPFLGCPPRPGEDDSIWGLFAQDGSEGPVGSTGSTGPAGPQGPKGDTGAQGAAGPAGPAGPAGGVSGYEVVTVNSPTGVAVGFDLVAMCPAGKVALGGGYSSPTGVNTSRPLLYGFEGGLGRGWRVIGNTGVYNSYGTAYAVCASG